LVLGWEVDSIVLNTIMMMIMGVAGIAGLLPVVSGVLGSKLLIINDVSFSGIGVVVW
jgi:hypothetical protein